MTLVSMPSGHVLGREQKDTEYNHTIMPLYLDGTFFVKANEWSTLPSSQHVTVKMSREAFQEFVRDCQELLDDTA